MAEGARRATRIAVNLCAMDTPAHPPIAWPGFSDTRAFVLPLRSDCMATPFGALCQLEGIRLRRKSELHVTVLNADMARAAAAGCGEARLRELYESLEWTPVRTGRYALLHQSKPTAQGPLECWSLIEHLRLPAMLAFRASLARLLGGIFEDPVPHVTHYVHGDPNGIGVPHRRALAALLVREIEP